MKKDKPNLSVSDLQSLLDTLPKKPTRGITLTSLVGDASTRHYYRMSFSVTGGTDQTFVLMQLESPQPGVETDYGKITRFLSRIGVPVPELLAYDDVRGILLIEDCGDIMFQDAIQACKSQRDIRRWYKKAIDLIARMQKHAGPVIGPDCPAFNIKFDVKKLMWEFDFMLSCYVEKLLCQHIGTAEREEIRHRFEKVCMLLAAEKTWFVHRDYHSRNIMIKNGELKIIDFQDARMGPCQYDLASLLRDSYVELPEEFVDSLIDYYITLMSADGKIVDRERFRYIFDLMALQRNLKAIGTFAFQKVRCGTDRYLRDIPRTISHVNKTLNRLPTLSDLRKSLARRIPGILPK